MEDVEYEIWLEGDWPSDWSAWFEALEVQSNDQSQTRLRGPIQDQSALFGLLKRVRDLGATLISVQRLNPSCQTESGVSTPKSR